MSDELSAKAQQDRDRYMNAAHAMQSAVNFFMEQGIATDTTPKHLRVGVNSMMVESSTLATILMEKGVFTLEEYYERLADMMEQEVKMYEASLPPHLQGRAHFR